MKYIRIITITIILLGVLNCKDHSTAGAEKSLSNEKKVSENAVLPFAPHIFSKFSNVRDLTISSDETEAYFTLQSPGRELSVIMKIRKEDKLWKDPEICPFSGRYTDLEPFLSPDNLKLYFVSNRPISNDSNAAKDMDIWYVERATTAGVWSEAKNLGAPVNTSGNEFYPSVCTNGNLYFTTIKEGSSTEDDIYMSQWQNNAYSEPVVLGAGVNTQGAEYNAFIAPDESYIIFGGWRRPDGLGSGDMYISKNTDGVWSEAKNLGPKINSEHMEFCPFVMDQTLYFTSRRSHVSQKETGFKSTQELLEEMNKYENGESRIYNVSFQPEDY